MTDLRYALRVLLKSPGFTCVAIVSLALGIGANTAIYSVIRAVLLDPLPVSAPEQLVELGWTGPPTGRAITTMGSSQIRDERSGTRYRSNFSYSLFRAFQQADAGADSVFAFSYAATDASVSLGGQSVLGSSLLVSGNFFRALGVAPSLGRTFTERDDSPAAEAVAVITHAFWTRAFGGDATVVGRPVRINGSLLRIVGVTPPAFFGMSKGSALFPPTDLLLPLSAQPLVYTRAPPDRRSLFGADDKWWLHVMARVTLDAARTRTESTLRATFQQSLAGSGLPAVGDPREWDLRLVPAPRGLDVLSGGMRQPLTILGGVVTIVLLIACANVGNLMLARSVARRRELSIRLAIGSGRWALVRGVLLEGALLALAGGAAGLLVGVWGGRTLVAMLGPTGRTALDVALDTRLLVSTATISGVAALLFSLVPAVWIARSSFPPALKGAIVGAGASRLSAGRLLMVGQVAISIPLLVGGALFLRTAHNLSRVDLGFNPERLVIFRVDPSLNGYGRDRIGQLYGQIVARLERIPGVMSATVSDVVLMSRLESNWTFTVGALEKNLKFARVGPGYFDTLGIPIVLGRAPGLQDDRGAPHVAVVNESAARALFGPDSPIGRRVSMRSEPPDEYEVVGVVKDSRYTSPRDPMPSTIYLPFGQTALGQFGPMNVAVRSTIAPASLEGLIRAAVAEVDRDVPVTNMKTQADQIDQTLGTERTFLRLLIAFGAFALLLASIGLFGVTSHSVARRTSEIGVRVALGARPRDVVWLIFRQVLAITIAGLAIGLPAALVGTRLVRATLYGVEPGDPLSLVTAAIVMAVVAGTAGYLPARRAARLDPLTALRQE
jgi:predicted permease